MEVAAARREGVLAVSLKGRLDGYGASRAEEALRQAIEDTDSFVVLDMSAVPYLSSGGIRVLVATHKLLARRGGGLHLCSLAAYPAQVLDMAGFDQLLPVHATIEAGVQACRALALVRKSEKEAAALPRVLKNGAEYTVFEAGPQRASLKVVGSLGKVLHATLRQEDIVARRFSETEYSLGLGALGGGVEDCIRLLGEMMTIGGTMVWLPTDGNDTPDFLIPQRDRGTVMIYTGLNVALDGGFDSIMMVEAKDESGHSLGDMYASVFEIARATHPEFKGLVSLAMLADIEGVCSSGVRIAPVQEFRPRNGGMIMDAENMKEWMAVNTTPRHQGRTMAAFGVGLDLAGNLGHYDKEALDNIFYLNPANVGSSKMMLHNHGVIFEPVPWAKTLELDAQIRRTAQEGKFVDMRHLLDSTRVRRAVIGVSHIQQVEHERQR